MAPVPVVDGAFVPDIPANLIRRGRFSRVDFLAGHCTNDGRTVVAIAPGNFTTNRDIVTKVFDVQWPDVVGD